jgi:8-oxo-dGTP diphosphatase
MKFATLCYIRDKNSDKTLMMHRVKKENDMHEGKWNGLGGKLEAGESPEECVIREVKEESGLVINNPIFKGFITFPAFDNYDDWYVFVFTADEFSGKLIDPDEGFLEWIPNNKILDLPLWEGDKIFLPWLENEKYFSAKFRYDKGKFTDYEVYFY